MARVLLVEGNETDIGSIPDVFCQPGAANFELTAVRRLSDALQLLSEIPIDVILLDPFKDASGLSILLALRVAAPAVPVVVWTESNDDDQAMLALQCGAEDYLTK